MCNNLQPIHKKSAIIYKIVAKKPRGTRYYSVAMGFIYPKRGNILVVRVQHCIAVFDRNILGKRSAGYNEKMIGRTAGFIKKSDAEKERDDWYRWASTFDKSFVFYIKKAKLTNGLMSGSYGDFPVIAGRHIEFLE